MAANLPQQSLKSESRSRRARFTGALSSDRKPRMRLLFLIFWNALWRLVPCLSQPKNSWRVWRQGTLRDLSMHDLWGNRGGRIPIMSEFTVPERPAVDLFVGRYDTSVPRIPILTSSLASSEGLELRRRGRYHLSGRIRVSSIARSPVEIATNDAAPFLEHSHRTRVNGLKSCFRCLRNGIAWHSKTDLTDRLFWSWVWLFQTQIGDVAREHGILNPCSSTVFLVGAPRFGRFWNVDSRRS
jgi:hypothetical protein